MAGERERARGPLMIGLTGPIGCGKSTVARILADCGGKVIDADVLARKATERGHPTLPQIRRRFGDEVFASAGELDRAAMARVVFRDAAALADLEAIVHPEVRRMVEEELASASTEDAVFVVIEAIKLVEGGLSARCDEVWLVECSAAAQRERLADRGASEEDIEQRLETQGTDLVGRLEALLTESQAAGGKRAKVRRLSTEGSLEQTRDRVEDALAEAFEADQAQGWTAP
jgi:dephospho-CoA kinase